MSEVYGIPLAQKVNVTSLVSAFHTVLPADFGYDGESHSGWEFVYVESGKIKATADDKTYIMKKGELVCHKPHEFHKINSYHGDAGVIIFCFHYDASEMTYFNNKILFVNQREQHYLNDIASNSPKIFLPKEPLEIVRDGSMDINPNSDPISEQFVKNTIEVLILSLLSAGSTERKKRIESYAYHVQRKTLTDDIKKYLEDNLSKKILISDIAKHFSYSQSSIKQIFYKEVGCGFTGYLNKRRIERAKELLLNNYSISNASEELGFETVNYFSTVFKRETGASPSNFLKEMKKKR